MNHTYQPLPLHPLERGIRFFCLRRLSSRRITFDDRAVTVMTDLSRVTACTVGRSTPLNSVLALMIERKVRLLLVCEPDGKIVGLLTSRDLSDGKAERILTKSGGAWEDLVAADVMTLRPKLEALLMEEVLAARVGDIVATLRKVDRQHALVLDRDVETEERAVRGIFSLSHIGLRLGLNIDPSRRPVTYAELARAGCAL
ncbi:MAG: CBS domain-containing protein [Candidatus Competibacter sp.]|jgi:CBS-domain-containing membrane protein|nr:CBS domain-containing protein [Candidatus Competibacteraceae bacterium]HRD68476.1 CBS domain-containing protein [Candidatus Competibacter sp.]